MSRAIYCMGVSDEDPACFRLRTLIGQALSSADSGKRRSNHINGSDTGLAAGRNVNSINRSSSVVGCTSYNGQ